MLSAAALGICRAENYKAVSQRVDAQIRLENLLHKIRRDSQMTPDYICLLVVASALAGLGLGTNNVVIIIASMLVSPVRSPMLPHRYPGIGPVEFNSLGRHVRD